MREAPGSSAAAPIWNAFIRAAYGKKTEDTKEMKNNSLYFSLPFIADEAQFPAPPSSSENNGVLGGEAGPHSILHLLSPSDPLGPPPENPFTTPQYRNWENAVLDWLNSSSVFLLESPQNSGEESLGIKISFISPTKHTFKKGGSIFLEALIETTSYIKTVKVFVDNQQITQLTPPTTNSRSFSFAQSVSLHNILEKNFHEIIVEAEDVNQKKKTGVFVFIVE